MPELTMSPTLPRIDAHQHFWDPERGEYPWLVHGSSLDRPYLPVDLAPLCADAGVGATILVQAAPTVAETRWLIEQAEDPDSLVVGIVGWVDLAADVESQLDALASNLLVGVRPMIQDLDPEWIRQSAVVGGLRALADRGLTFELLASPRHLESAADILEQINELRVVVDHLAKPHYRAWDEKWAHQISRLAVRELTWMKVSGLATEVEAPAVAGDFSRHVEFVLEEFSPDRVMLGSDWPISTLALDHAATIGLLDELVAGCSVSELSELWRGSCSRAYALDIRGT